MIIDIFKIKVGDRIKVRHENVWLTVEKIKELEAKIGRGVVLKDRIFYFVEPHTPASGPNVREVEGWDV